MSKSFADHRAVVDAFASEIADLAIEPGEPELQRLQTAVASALRAQLRTNPSLEVLPPALTRLERVVPKRVRAALLPAFEALEAAPDRPDEILAVVRRDEQKLLRASAVADRWSGLIPADRLGPFVGRGGLEIFFEVFRAARRLELRETGTASPTFVFTSARPPVSRRITTIDVAPGTVWIRGALLDPTLPAAAYVGIRVAGGTLRLSQPHTLVDNRVEVPAPMKGSLELQLAAETVEPVDGACFDAGADVSLPATLRFTLADGVLSATGDAGKAQVYGQTFAFDRCIGDWRFIAPLWTAVLDYTVQPTTLDAAAMSGDLLRLVGEGQVAGGGLGLPVVLAPNPAILGEAARAASWFLSVEGLLGRWYAPDPRLHALGPSWLGISPFGATLLAEQVAPLSPPVSYSYALWTIAGSEQRLPWQQRYAAPFLLSFSCDVQRGATLLVRGQADLALDRPVTTSGAPITTSSAQSTVQLQQFGGVTIARLSALFDDAAPVQQLALRNALVWAGTPSSLFVRGELLDGTRIDAGQAQLQLGVFGWAPTLPDPYVSNAFVRRPRAAGIPKAVLLALIGWTSPRVVSLAFEGRLGNRLALGARARSPLKPRPFRPGKEDPDLGLTQVEQQRLTFTKREEVAWREAQASEVKTRGERLEQAQQHNQTSLSVIDRFIEEVAGPAPAVLLLDVSTNQDLLGVAMGGPAIRQPAGAPDDFTVNELAVHANVSSMRVVALPQVQWEPVRTLDADQDIMTMGWFPTPLASPSDGGATRIGARFQRLVPIIPEDAVQGTLDAHRAGVPVGIATTFPFGLVAAVRLAPQDAPDRPADLYGLTRPSFPDEQARGGIQITAKAEGGRPDNGGISPTFGGVMLQLLNGVDLSTGDSLGISVLGSNGDPNSNVEKVFNNDMLARPRVPVTRIDLSGYGGSNFSDWNNPFAAFAEAAKVQFRFTIGRTALEVIKVNSVLHPWGIRVTRSVTVERRSGGGVIRRDSGWQAFTPGLFDYRYFEPAVDAIVVALYSFDAGVFRGLFNVRNIRPAPGAAFSHGISTLVPYYFDAEVALEHVPGRTAATGMLGYLQTAPNGVPADVDALQALIQAQGPIGGPVEAWMNFGGSGLPFRVQRVEVGLAMNGATPLFVATARGAPSLPTTGAWSVVSRPVASVPPGGGEAVPVAESRGVPVVRRYPVRYLGGDRRHYPEPRLDGVPGDYRFADAADLLTPAAPANDYALLQSTPTHAFLFPRPFVPAASGPRILSGFKPALADVLARTTSKGAFPPPANTIEVGGGLHFDVAPSGALALSAPVTITSHPTPLRLGGSRGHGSVLFYDGATLNLSINPDSWSAEFIGLRIWADIAGMERLCGSEMRITGSTNQRSQIAEIRSLILQEVEEMLNFMPFVGDRGTQGPIDLGGTNAKHELKLKHGFKVKLPVFKLPPTSPVLLKLYLTLNQALGIDLSSGKLKVAYALGAALDGKILLTSVGVVSVFLQLGLEVEFSLATASGSVKDEKLTLIAFVGIGVTGNIGPFEAYAFLAVGFAMAIEFNPTVKSKYGGIVLLEAGIDLVCVVIKVRAELRGLVYKDAGVTKCDFIGAVKVQVDLFLILSISATYQISDTATFS